MLCSPPRRVHGAAVGQARLRAGLVLLMLPGGLSSPGPTLSSDEKRAAEKVPPLLPVLSSPYRDRLLSPHPRYPNDAPWWRGELYALMRDQTETTGTSVLRALDRAAWWEFHWQSSKRTVNTSHFNCVLLQGSWKEKQPLEGNICAYFACKSTLPISIKQLSLP